VYRKKKKLAVNGTAKARKRIKGAR